MHQRVTDLITQPTAALDAPVVDKGVTTGVPNVAYFTENETGQIVEVETFHLWAPLERMHSVRYSSGRKYGVSEAVLSQHFSIVSPQEVFFTAFGGVDDRPTPKQCVPVEAA